MEIYKAIKYEKKELVISNLVSTNSVVYINEIEFDNVTLASGFEKEPNLRVLELDLKAGYIVTVKENELVNYEVK